MCLSLSPGRNGSPVQAGDSIRLSSSTVDGYLDQMCSCTCTAAFAVDLHGLQHLLKGPGKFVAVRREHKQSLEPGTVMKECRLGKSNSPATEDGPTLMEIGLMPPSAK